MEMERTKMRPAWRACVGILFAVLAASGVALRPACAWAGCPASVLTYWFHFQGGDTWVPATAFDTTIVNADGDTTRVGFDRAAARIWLHAIGREWAGERVLERFDVTGVPEGTPVQATIVLTLEGQVYNSCGGGGCGSHFGATVATATDSTFADASIPGPCDDCTRPVSTTMTLPVTLTAGAPVDAAFALLYHTTYVAYGRAFVTATYGVSGLPPGVRAVECSEADVTPARTRTWGRLKAAYR